MTTIVHVQLVKGPRQSVCGLRQIETRRSVLPNGELLAYIPDLSRIPDLKPGYEWCSVCTDHPAFQLKLLSKVDL